MFYKEVDHTDDSNMYNLVVIVLFPRRGSQFNFILVLENV